MFFRSFFTNSVGILTSRILGFIRDLLTASILGANIYSDIFFVAFKLPNLFRRIFGEGAFSQAFLPTFTKSCKKGVFASRVLVVFTFFILLLTFFIMLFAPIVTKLLAFGFNAQTITLAAPLVKINFWYLFFIFLVTFSASLLYYKNHFATTAFSTALLNISLIVALLLSNTKTPDKTVYLMSYGVIIGGFLQLFVHIIALKKHRMLGVLCGGLKRYKSSKKVVENEGFYRLFFHGLMGSSAAQLSAFIDTWLASFLVYGNISYLYYANRVFQLPLAIFAIALSVGIFPSIAKAIKFNDEKKADNLLYKGFWFLFSMLLICTIGGVMLSDEIIQILFQRGSFTQHDTTNTSLILAMYLVGLLPFGLSKIFSLWLYAKQKQKQAAKISIYSLVANILLSLALIKPYGAAGLAFASSVSGFILLGFTIKIYGIKKFLDIIIDKKLFFLAIALGGEIIILYIFKDILDAYL